MHRNYGLRDAQGFPPVAVFPAASEANPPCPGLIKPLPPPFAAAAEKAFAPPAAGAGAVAAVDWPTGPD